MDFSSWDAGLHTQDPNSLQHYGVLGMKWGQRRYQNSDGSLTAAGKRHYEQTGEYGYHYKSHATKKYTRKANRANNKASKIMDGEPTPKSVKKAEKLLKKADKYSRRAELSAKIDRGEQEYAKSLSTGKAIALTLLGGGQALKGYAQYRSMAGQKGNNFTGQKAMAGIKAYRRGASGSRLAKAAYIRQDEKKTRFNALGKDAYAANKMITDIGANVIDRLAGTSSYNKKKKHGNR